MGEEKTKKEKSSIFTNIIAVDFDGTIVENQFPNIGKELPGAFDALNEIHKKFYLILWTCRIGDALQKAIEFCKERGLVFDAINENVDFLPFQTSQKVWAYHYIDDRSGFKDWEDELRKVNELKIERFR